MYTISWDILYKTKQNISLYITDETAASQNVLIPILLLFMSWRVIQIRDVMIVW